MKIWAVNLIILCAGFFGCQAQSQLVKADIAVNRAAAPQSKASKFDFYLLNLSWSPEFCVTHPGKLECTQHRGFIVHGLWPENNDGSYPQHCGNRPGPTNPAEWADVMPDTGLVKHEWQTHGTCTPFDANTYFGMIRKAFQTVKQPAEITSAGPNTMLTPAAIIADFARDNPTFPAGSIALSCGNNHLTAVEVCMNKDLQPIACSGVKSCKAKNVKITPK